MFPLTAGFCNDVFSLHPPCSQPLVLKVFSPMAKARGTPEDRLGVVDSLASDYGLGPQVVYVDDDFCVTTFVKGDTLEECEFGGGRRSSLCFNALKSVHFLTTPPTHTHTLLPPLPPFIFFYGAADVHGYGRYDEGADLCKRLGAVVGNFHSIRAEGNRLKDSLRRMAKGIGGEEAEKWLQQVERICSVLEKVGGDGILCHGDLKPSNVMAYKDDDNPCNIGKSNCGDVRLIDFELSGGGMEGLRHLQAFQDGQQDEGD